MRDQGQTSCWRPTHTFSSIATVAERLVTLLGYANRRGKGKSTDVGLSVRRQLTPLHSGNSLANTRRIVGGSIFLPFLLILGPRPCTPEAGSESLPGKVT